MEELTINAIKNVCNELANFLIDKNRAYGNAIFDPICVFSTADSNERIAIRIDDKLSRIARGHEYGNDDTELDIIGYLILKRVAKELEKDENQRFQL